MKNYVGNTGLLISYKNAHFWGLEIRNKTFATLIVRED